MQSYLISQITLCKFCAKHLYRHSFNYRIARHSFSSNTNSILPKSVIKPKKVKKDHLQLKVKQFPQLLKYLEKHEKKIASNSESALSMSQNERLNTNLNETHDNQMASKGVSDNSNTLIPHELIEISSEEWDLIEKELGINNFNVFHPEHGVEKSEELELLSNIENDKNVEIKVMKKNAKRKVKSKRVNEEEEMRKTIIKENDEKSRNFSLKHSLKSYLYACIYSDMILKGHSALLYYRSKYLKRKEINGVTNPIDCSVYNILLRGWARRGKTFRIKELLNLMKTSNVTPNGQSYAYYLLALSKQMNPPSVKEIASIVEEMKNNNVIPEDMLNDCVINIDERNRIINLLEFNDPHYKHNPPKFVNHYNCRLLKSLKNVQQKYINPSEGVHLDSLNSWSKQQFDDEIRGNLKVNSVAKDKLSKKQKSFYHQRWEQTENEWKRSVKDAFLRHLKILQHQSNVINGLTMYPYMTVMDPQFYVDAVIEEIRVCSSLSEYYSPSMISLYSLLGRKIMLKYLIKTQLRDGTVQNHQELYEKYLEYYKTPELMRKYNPREFWQKLIIENNHYYNNDSFEKIWPNHVQIGVGQYLYNIIIREVKLDVNILNKFNGEKRLVPAFYITYKSIGDGKYKQEFRPHPTLTKLSHNACLENLIFDSEMLPMISPPLPWINDRHGGYLLTKTDFVRMPEYNSTWIIGDTKNQDLYPTFDSLNSLSLVPWIINKKVLDLAIEIFNKSGDSSLDIPKPQSEFPQMPKIETGMSKFERMNVYRQRDFQKKEMSNMYSLWCDCLYKLSIANHYRDRVFWFPNNADFRGRVYPVPPHFNHLGNDLTRGILLFAKGQPLGKNGFDWLKIHLVNLTGLKKRSSIKERLEFANEMMPIILDSADNPLDGQKWWVQSDEPWQTLACCMEIARVSRCSDPTKYISHYPIHQDGSCNGLQHYAALGRDQHGAESVNLHPAKFPQDVYSDVAMLVEKERVKDAENGNEIAVLLDGHISRKVVKQTVMTYVYGVTRFGARLQIYKRLKEIEDIPKAKTWACSAYLTQKTFLSIQQMFTETRFIQDWLTDCAKVISKSYCKSVHWITPLGFPVIQPYYKSIKKRGEIFFGFENSANVEYKTQYDAFQKPNTVKQKNAFPPNFIHSLDSSHMMLTSLYCHTEGITFASVHDCFWTHANCVEIMNVILRQQFVNLHNEPIIDDLSKYLVKHFKDLEIYDGKTDSKRTLSVLGHKLNKGSFKLENILQSTYFFS